MTDELWRGMPEFHQPRYEPFKKIAITITRENSRTVFCRFATEEDYRTFCAKLEPSQDPENLSMITCWLLGELCEQPVTPKTKSLWFPFKSHWGGVRHRYKTVGAYPVRYPVYVVSKGRYDNCLTSKALNVMGVPHALIVEKQEYHRYKARNHAEVLTLPKEYQERYDTFDDLGNTKSKGPGPARNFAKDHSMESGHLKHWVMDDNLDAFHYLNRNEKLEVDGPSTLAAAEDFADRYTNAALVGMNYYSFCKKEDAVPPLVLNTRIYSCLLIDNGFDYPWRGRYNEDTDLSLRVLKDGLCTIQFNAFLCGKVTTQRMKGGNTKEFYSGEGTLPKSEMLAAMHPDVAEVVWKFNRWHHKVDYRPFANNQLIRSGVPIPEGVNNYGLTKVEA